MFHFRARAHRTVSQRGGLAPPFSTSSCQKTHSCILWAKRIIPAKSVSENFPSVTPTFQSACLAGWKTGVTSLRRAGSPAPRQPRWLTLHLLALTLTLSPEERRCCITPLTNHPSLNCSSAFILQTRALLPLGIGCRVRLDGLASARRKTQPHWALVFT